jgi:hypothetical protein
MAILVLPDNFSDFDSIFLSDLFLKVGPDKIYASPDRGIPAAGEIGLCGKVSMELYGANGQYQL